MVAFLVTLWWLLVGHAIGDFAGVSEHAPRTDDTPWYYHLTGHAALHGGIVTLFTGNPFLGMLESVLHWLIDFARNEGLVCVHSEQLLHVLCKLLWAAWLWFAFVMV